MRKINWGIVGAGRIAASFAQDMRFVSEGKLVAVAARHAERAAAFAHQHGIGRAHGGYAALYADPEVEAVYIATPHSEHFANASAALHAGKAVLCEKPLTLNPDECRRLRAIAAETGGYLMEGMWTYFLPAIRQAVDWVGESVASEGSVARQASVAASQRGANEHPPMGLDRSGGMPGMV